MARRKTQEQVVEGDAPAQEKKSSAHEKQVDKLLHEAQEFFTEKHGEGAAQLLSAADTLSRVESWVSTGSMVVDTVILGGRPKDGKQSLIPFGRQTEISGLNGTGKTSLCAQTAAEVQAMGGIVVVTDTEERIDHPYWKSLGVDTERILNITARTLEDVFTRQIEFIQWVLKRAKSQPILMLWDSLGGTTTDSLQDELEDGDIQEAAKKIMMQKAKIISNNMELINPLIARAKIAYVYTNTVYLDPMVKYGDPYKTPGGNKKDFFATLRLRLKKVGQIADKDEKLNKKTIHGHDVEVSTVKNSMAPKLLAIKGAVLGDIGFSDEYTVKDLAETMGAISTKGSWTTWTGDDNFEAKFQGWQGFIEMAQQHPEQYAKLKAMVASAL